MNTWKTISISLLLSLVFAVASYFMPADINFFWSIVVSVFTFLISYVFLGLLEYVKTIKQSEVNKQYIFFQKCGIADYFSDFTKIDFAPSIDDAHNIRVVLLYSHRFLNNHISQLQNFVERERTSLEIILLTNDQNSLAYKCVTKKFNYREEKIQQSIKEFSEILREQLMPLKGGQSSITLYCTELIPAYSLYMFDNHAYISLYKTAPQRTNLIPCFRIEKANDSSLFNFVLDDFNQIKEHPATQKIELK